MKKLIITAALAIVLAACIPIFNPNFVTITAERTGNEVTATLSLTEDSTEVAIHWSNPVDDSTIIGDVAAGQTVTDTVTTADPVDCSATGNTNGRPWRKFCSAP